MASPTMVPFIAPDGTTGSIPQDQVNAAMQAGGKLGVRIAAPDGTPGTIPMDRVHDAINAGGRLIGMSDVAKPQVDMKQSALAPLQNTDKNPPPLQFGGMHGGSYDIAFRDPQGQISPDTIKAEAIGGGIGAAASPYAIPAAVGAVKAAPQIAKNIARNAPSYIAGVAGAGAIDYARKNLPLGKYIPPGAEILAYLAASGKGGSSKAAAAKETAKEAVESSTANAAAAEVAAASENVGESVPVGKFTKEVPNPEPYQFSGAPKSMDIVQSTNVGKVGYNPDAKVMTVEYKSGFVYSYHGVPQKIYQDALESESVGSYISRNIKGRYDTVRRGSVLVKKSR